MDNLAHYRCPVLQNIVVRVCLHGKASRAYPLGILGRELTIELCWLVEGGDGMEIGRVGVWRRYCAGDGVSEGDLLPQGSAHSRKE